MRKNIFYTLMLGVMTLASCNKQIDGPTFKAQDGEIFFGSKGLTVETKAVTESTVSVLQSNGFNAAIALDTDGAVMFNKAVAYNGGVYTVPGETYYYPVEGTVSAYAVYPKTETITLDAGVATIDYSQNANEDLVVAKVGGVAKQSSAINLNFAHALSQVSFKAKGSDTKANYVLKLIEVTAPNGGTYQYADGTWTNLGEATAYTAYTNAGAAVSTSSFQSFGESMTFIPGEVSLRAVWDCKNKVDGTIVGQYDQTVQATLVAGEHATLNLILPNSDAQEIKFMVSVGAWQNSDMEITVEESSDGPLLLPGEFTVNGSGKKVRFAKGNLYWNGSKFSLEENQLAYRTSWDPNHVDCFFWSKDAAVARAERYDDPSAFEDDTFFAADGGAIEGLTVLSVAEWNYLLSHSLYSHTGYCFNCEMSETLYYITVDGKRGAVLKPDGFSGSINDEYTLDEWATAEAEGLVFLPFAGSRSSYSGYSGTDTEIYLWSCTPFGAEGWEASYVFIGSCSRECFDEGSRSAGNFVRLVGLVQ